MDHAAVLVDHTARLAALAAAADPATPVPTCPEWSLGQLARHVGRGHRWAAEIVRGGEFVHPSAVADGTPSGDQALWLTGASGLLLDAVARTGSDSPVWTFTGPRPATWWVRRRACEAVVHHADAALALDAPFAAAPEAAADTISEWLGLLADGFAKDPILTEGTSLHLHATDGAGEWLVRPGPVWEHTHEKATVALRGPVTDLMLVLLRRRPLATVEVLGDGSVAEDWLERTAF
ncbi:maleylpyruvate isomerase family mycothiol-dependent enzyme [Actinokineospora diospyrosa]|uniref:TIGR03083 family protein n=1 Tax=Actinokineospora diospyrosa TaxID=103728 RepID=A0ABT1I8X9_9PSEU|nr:maleylpyruvate isomerase family mycothiol-dependent enzyme [Actinokineospora diospyrosa]MCP2269047.1 TIGR03083 family protein [Actinokineospora diospyrosa]